MMGLVLKVVVVVACLAKPFGSAAALANGDEADEPQPAAESAAADDHYDFLIFSQVWPPTSCYEWQDKSPSNGCNLPREPGRWTIHGLWPSKNHSMGPFYCNHSAHFDLDSLEPIRQQLELEWLDVHKGAKPHEFWRHEWQKHGSCSLDLAPLSTELGYFKTGLRLLERYDMHGLLADASVLPGASYLPERLLAGLGRLLRKRPYLECVANRHRNESYVSELRICFDKAFGLIDCDPVLGFPTNCKRDTAVLYPASVPPRLHDRPPVAIQV